MFLEMERKEVLQEVRGCREVQGSCLVTPRAQDEDAAMEGELWTTNGFE